MLSRRELLLGALGLAAASALPTQEACKTEPKIKEKPRRPKIETNPYFDSNPEYLVPVKGGEFSKEEKKHRTEVMPNGETIFHDIGLDLYKVKAGDNPGSIRESLSKYPQYAHLADQTDKMHSFNIPPTVLQIDMWLPIPLENKDREMSDEQFARYAKQGIDDIKGHPQYGEFLKEVIAKIGERDLIATLIAVAKQESGGKPLGQFEMHRWEKKYKAFSFSMLHILMEKNGPGLSARHNLDMTQGQTYHPRNAAKLFIGYLVEKTNDPLRLFPIDQHYEKFASFYNGSDWESTNGDYVVNVTRYYKEAQALLEEHPELINGDS